MNGILTGSVVGTSSEDVSDFGIPMSAVRNGTVVFTEFGVLVSVTTEAVLVGVVFGTPMLLIVKLTRTGSIVGGTDAVVGGTDAFTELGSGVVGETCSSASPASSFPVSTYLPSIYCLYSKAGIYGIC